MAYFTNFPLTNYTFGTQPAVTAYQNLGIYVDLVDQVKDDAAFYEYYNVKNGDRADQISQVLYGRPDLHWTFFLLNDKVKLRGWPRTYSDIVAQAKKDYPNSIVTTRTDLGTKMKVGSTIEGKTSGQKGIILRRLLDNGQLVVGRVAVERTVTATANAYGHVTLELETTGERYADVLNWTVTLSGSAIALSADKILEGGTNYSNLKYNFGFTGAFQTYVFKVKVFEYQNAVTFTAGEVISTIEDDVEVSAVVDTSSLEYLATHHYEDASGNYADITPNAPFAQRTSYTFTLNYVGVDLTDATAVYNATLAAVVTDVEISAAGDYNKKLDLTNVAVDVAKGNYRLDGQILRLGAALSLLLADTGSTTAAFVFAIWASEIASATSDPTYTGHIFGELATAWALADKDGSGNATIKFHSFFLIDNLLNVIGDTEQFGQTFEYPISGTTVYKNTYGNSGTFTTTSPAPSSRSDAWLDITTQLELYTQQNLSNLVPSALTQVNYLDRYVKSNDELKNIKVLRPSVAKQLDAAYQSTLLEQKTEAEVAVAAQTQVGQTNPTVSNTTQSVTSVAGQTVTSSSASVASSSSSSSGGGYY
jgi:hypothetical protein